MLNSRRVCGCRDGCHLSPLAIGLRVFGGRADWRSPLGGGVSPRRQTQGRAQPGAAPEGVCALLWQWVTAWLSLNTLEPNGVMTSSGEDIKVNLLTDSWLKCSHVLSWQIAAARTKTSRISPMFPLSSTRMNHGTSVALSALSKSHPADILLIWTLQIWLWIV